MLHKHQGRVELCMHLMYVVMASFLILTLFFWIETLAIQKGFSYLTYDTLEDGDNEDLADPY